MYVRRNNRYMDVNEFIDLEVKQDHIDPKLVSLDTLMYEGVEFEYLAADMNV